MKKILPLLLVGLMLTGCAGNTVTEITEPETTAAVETQAASAAAAPEYVSRFEAETRITLSDEGILVDTQNSGADESSIVITNDIVYYEDRDTYDSGNPYGEGTDSDKHTAEEAAAHTVVNITQPGAYRVSGTLSAGQIRIDLGSNAYYDPEAVVELILDNADISCTVAPAILFQNVYECDGEWSTDTATSLVDTTAAGANLILEGQNTVSGSYVARIYKDTEGEKKLWKQDGALYSYMSMNVFGPGALSLTAENEGLDTELHLTINGGDITIHAGNDGINTNEDGVSVTTVNGGNVRIIAGLGDEGDGIDSNGYLVINGGSVIASANPAADAGLDSDLGSFINGGTVIAMGSTMDWAESDSDQVTMNLQFAAQQKAGSKITITREDGTEIFSFEDDSSNSRPFSGLILSHFGFTQGETYYVYIDGVQQAYGGTDLGMGFGGGRGGRGQMGGGQMPDGMEFPEGDMPEGMEFPDGMTRPEGEGMTRPEGEAMERSEGETMPEDFDPAQMGGGRGQRNEESMTPPEGFDGEMPTMPEGMEMPEMPEGGSDPQTAGSTEFYMSDKVNAFSGVAAAN